MVLESISTYSSFCFKYLKRIKLLRQKNVVHPITLQYDLVGELF